jgi:hypothetical protein
VSTGGRPPLAGARTQSTNSVWKLNAASARRSASARPRPAPARRARGRILRGLDGRGDPELLGDRAAERPRSPAGRGSAKILPTAVVGS